MTFFLENEVIRTTIVEIDRRQGYVQHRKSSHSLFKVPSNTCIIQPEVRQKMSDLKQNEKWKGFYMGHLNVMDCGHFLIYEKCTHQAQHIFFLKLGCLVSSMHFWEP